MANVPEERREKILSELKNHGYLSVAELAKVLFVSIPTVRRDLNVLEREGTLVRTHGGASGPAGGQACLQAQEGAGGRGRPCRHGSCHHLRPAGP